ncbi:hypothetical protein AVEN_102751-1 [Araneus ventricosus]|uniref:Endonuclease/exonuclease/phosphatase domain-containing protein n=1 Tax=Araneus ventricosus TaxID=182803 RepID=A0A4Y2VUV1_ARAVE|nr:hypothetical protein AVEN_102751-1 [Araneus ventricosus]
MEVKDFLMGPQLLLLNEKKSPPTFEQRGTKGWPDLSITKGPELTTTCNRKVLYEFSHSDHKYIETDIMINQTKNNYLRFKSANGVTIKR